jgi:predicted DNA-binding transcriptional regulator AlpA
VELEKLASVSDIANMLGVAIPTAHRYTHREGFPEPLGVVAGGRVWRRKDVLRWAARTLPLQTGRPRKDR